MLNSANGEFNITDGADFVDDHGVFHEGSGLFAERICAVDQAKPSPSASQASSALAPLLRQETGRPSASKTPSALPPASLRLQKTTEAHPLELLINAHSTQSSGADVLSAPRVVTKSGEEATIRVGQLHTYPEVYEPNASGGNIVHVKYEDWEEKLLGVELSVTPASGRRPD